MGSTRLKGKVLKKIYKDKTILDFVIENLKKLNSKIIIATTQKTLDKRIVEKAKFHKVDYFCGDEDNVLNRFIECARKYDVSDIIRVTADNVFIQPYFVDKMIRKNKSDLDYISYKIGSKNVVLMHLGFFCEYVKLDALEKVARKTTNKKDLEHVTYNIYNHPKEFKIEYLEVPKDLRREDIRLTIDTFEDFKLCRKIIKYLIENDIEWHYNNILDYVQKKSKIMEQMKKNILNINRN